MFPNPQDALPLPRRPSAASYGVLAQDLVEAFRSGDGGALAAFVDRWIASLSLAWAAGADEDKGEQERARRAADRAAGQVEDFARRHLAGGCSLGEAQVVLARAHGFATWARFSGHLERGARGDDAFEAAADDVVAGDEPALRARLAADPGLARATSDREHGATLLIYTSANGVESYRQRTPANVVRIAEILLDAGADVDATADVYGGGCTTLGLAATSAHPRRAGVQLPLLQLLLDRGARMEDGIAGGASGAVLGCLGNGCPEAAAYLADRGARVHLVEAAGLGRLETVARILDAGGATPAQVNEGLRYACAYGQSAVAELLIERGADLASTTGDGQTAAHTAVIAGHLATLQMLLGHGPPLEQENVYGGTVLGQTLWSAAHGGSPDRYIAIIDALLAAGAKLPDRHVPVNAQVDAFLAAKGSRPEPAWHWFGEKPRSA
jgi:ankyrin repeat protein